MTTPTNAEKVAHALVECSPQVEDDPREWMPEARAACRALGIDPDGTDPHAAAVAAERERCADAVDDAPAAVLAAREAAATAVAERERCAGIADTYEQRFTRRGYKDHANAAQQIAAAIRQEDDR